MDSFVDSPTDGWTMDARVAHWPREQSGGDASTPRLPGRAAIVEPSSCEGTLPSPAFPGLRADLIHPSGSTQAPGFLSPSMGGSKPHAAAAGRPHQSEPAGWTVSKERTQQ